MTGSVILPDIQESVTRSFEVGVQFQGESKRERLNARFLANDIVRQLQRESYNNLTPEVVIRADAIVRANPKLKGTRGSTKIRNTLGKGYSSNLSESYYLYLLNALKNMHRNEEKLTQFISLFSEHPQQLFEWLLLGRTPYLERQFQYRLRTNHKYACDLVQSSRRNIDSVLPENLQLTNDIKKPTNQAFHETFLSVYETKRIEFDLDQTGKRTPDSKCKDRQLTFFNKLQFLTTNKDFFIPYFQTWITEWNANQSNRPRSRWRHLSNFSRVIEKLALTQFNTKYRKYALRSVIRELLVTALIPLYSDGWTVDQLVNEILDPHQMVALPFMKEKNKYRQKLPIQLVMGHKYVIPREGNSSVLTEKAKEQGSFEIHIHPKRRKKHGVYADVLIHPKIQAFLTNGATISSLVITAKDAPARKIAVRVIMNGQRWMFLSQKAIQHQVTEFCSQNIQLSAEFIRGLGLDINKLGESMLAFSEAYSLSNQMRTTIRNYKKLAHVIRKNSHQLTIKRQDFFRLQTDLSRIRWLKQQSEMERLYARQKRVLKTIHQQSSRFITAVLLDCLTPLFSVEDLKLSAKHTRGALAKAILSLPDEPEISEIATMTANWIGNLTIALERVNPQYTSQAPHLDCSVKPVGKIRKNATNSDLGTCSGCKTTLMIHTHASRVIRNRGYKQHTINPANLKKFDALQSSTQSSAQPTFG